MYKLKPFLENFSNFTVSQCILIHQVPFSPTHVLFNISNVDKEVNKELPEDDLVEDRNMLECFLKCFK